MFPKRLPVCLGVENVIQTASEVNDSGSPPKAVEHQENGPPANTVNSEMDNDDTTTPACKSHNLRAFLPLVYLNQMRRYWLTHDPQLRAIYSGRQ
jgi:hypothetical protein